MDALGEETMNIVIEKSDDHYRADCKDLPGTPPVGLGSTPEMAVAHLCWCMLYAHVGASSKRWIDFVDKDEPIIVNGVRWHWPDSYRRS